MCDALTGDRKQCGGVRLTATIERSPGADSDQNPHLFTRCRETAAF